MHSRSDSFFLCLFLSGAQLSQSIFLSDLGFVQRRFGNQVSCWGKSGWDLIVGESTNGNMLGRGNCRDPEQMVREEKVVAIVGASESCTGSCVRRQ